MTTTNPIASSTNSPKNRRQFIPPRNSTPMAMQAMTAKAPKSGSRSSSAPTNSITASIGRKPLRRLCIQAALRTV